MMSSSSSEQRLMNSGAGCLCRDVGFVGVDVGLKADFACVVLALTVGVLRSALAIPRACTASVPDAALRCPCSGVTGSVTRVAC